MRAYNRLNDEDKSLIVSTYWEDAEDFDGMAEKLNVSRRAVTRVLKEAGVKTSTRHRYTLNASYFSSIDTEEKAYLLGLLAADGCIPEVGNAVILQLNDKCLLDQFAAAVNYTGQIRQASPRAWRINFSSEEMANDLRRLGICANTQILDFPLMDSIFYPAFILGYFDGDGCAHVRPGQSGGQVNIIASGEFCSVLRKYFGTGGINPHKCGLSYWRVHSRTDFEMIYKVFYPLGSKLGLPRKKERMEQILGNYKLENHWKKHSTESTSL